MTPAPVRLFPLLASLIDAPVDQPDAFLTETGRAVVIDDKQCDLSAPVSPLLQPVEKSDLQKPTAWSTAATSPIEGGSSTLPRHLSPQGRSGPVDDVPMEELDDHPVAAPAPGRAPHSEEDDPDEPTSDAARTGRALSADVAPVCRTCIFLGPGAVGIGGVTPVPVVYLPHQDPAPDTAVPFPPAYPGATWVELAIDFRLATGQPLVGVGRGAEGTLKEMTQMFRTLVRRVVQITESGRSGLAIQLPSPMPGGASPRRPRSPRSY